MGAPRDVLSFSYAPLDLIAWLAFVTVGLSVVAASAQIVLRFVDPSLAPKGFTSLLVRDPLPRRDPAPLPRHHRLVPRAHLRRGQAPAARTSSRACSTRPARENRRRGRRPVAGPQPTSGTRRTAEHATRLSAPSWEGGREARRRDRAARASIGANVARRLLDDGYEPTLLTGPGSDCWRLAEVEGDAPIVQLDLADGDAVARAVADGAPEWILHLAAHGAYSWQTDRAGDPPHQRRRHGATCSKPARRADVEAFVNTGSSSEYGLKERAPTEDDAVEPNSAYAVAKAVGHDAVPPRRRGATDSTSARSGSTRRTAHGRSRSASFRRSPSRASTAGFRRSSTRRRRATSSGSATSSTPTSSPPRPSHVEPGAVYNVGTGDADDGRRGGGDRAERARRRGEPGLGQHARSLVGHGLLGGRQLQDPAIAELAADPRLPGGVRGARIMVPCGARAPVLLRHSPRMTVAPTVHTPRRAER